MQQNQQDLLSEQLITKNEIQRKKLLPLWIKIFAWIFLVISVFVPVVFIAFEEPAVAVPLKEMVLCQILFECVDPSTIPYTSQPAVVEDILIILFVNVLVEPATDEKIKIPPNSAVVEVLVFDNP